MLFIRISIIWYQSNRKDGFYLSERSIKYECSEGTCKISSPMFSDSQYSNKKYAFDFWISFSRFIDIHFLSRFNDVQECASNG